MKKICIFAAAILFCLPLCSLFAAAECASADNVSAQAAILIEADSGEIVFEKNAHQKLPMASTTKIMTALVALEEGDLSKTVKVPEGACGVEGSSIYLTSGEELTLEHLLYALMLESANDAAAAIAYEIAGGIEPFAERMNRMAENIGLTESHFTNPHGLDDDAHYTTAYDLAKLTAYALKNEQFRKIVSTYKHQIPLRGDEGIRVLLNHNKLLRMSEDAIGVKTGFTKRSGRCLVSAAERNGVRVIAVTLNAPDDWNDHLFLHETGFSRYHLERLAEEGQFTFEIPCPTAENGVITVTNTDSLSVCLKNGTEVTYVAEAPHLFMPPVTVGDVLGRVTFTADGNVIGEIPLYAQTSVAEPEYNRSLGQKLLDKFH